jgi:hypothetical protein
MSPAKAPAGARVSVIVDVVARGKGLLTCGAGDFSGVILRRDGRYLVENEWGEVLGYRSTFKAGAALLARHHGYRLGRFDIEHEWREFGA